MSVTTTRKSTRSSLHFPPFSSSFLKVSVNSSSISSSSQLSCHCFPTSSLPSPFSSQLAGVNSSNSSSSSIALQRGRGKKESEGGREREREGAAMGRVSRWQARRFATTEARTRLQTLLDPALALTPRLEPRQQQNLEVHWSLSWPFQPSPHSRKYLKCERRVRKFVYRGRNKRNAPLTTRKTTTANSLILGFLFFFFELFSAARDRFSLAALLSQQKNRDKKFP